MANASPTRKGLVRDSQAGLLGLVYTGAWPGAVALGANTALTGVLVGTPVMPALAVDSIVISNLVADGDVAIAGNRGGNSENYLVADVSAGILSLFSPNGALVLTTPDGSAVRIPDDRLLSFGTSDDARLSWDTTDANANELLVQLPAGGAVNVPVIVIGQAIESVDLGLYNGVVDPRIAMFGVGAVTTGPILEFRKARGTVGSPTVVTTGDDLGTVDFYGAVAAGEYVRAASIRADMAGTIATTRGPGNLSFNVATDAAPSVMTERLLLTGSGQINVTPSTDVTFANATGIVIGHTAQVLFNGDLLELQMLGTANIDSHFMLAQWIAASGGPGLNLAKSRNAAIGSFTIVVTGDTLGSIRAIGDDGVDFNANDDASAEIRFVAAGTMAADRVPGEIQFWTATDAAPMVETQRMTITNAGLVDMLYTARIGVAGTRTGTLGISGATSGTVTVTVAAVAGTWTMQLPAAVGSGGQQLTDAGGDGITSWGAASLGAWKHDLGILDPHEALRAVVSAPTHKFTYNAAVMPAGQWAPPDRMVGIFAEEAPWAMHGKRADEHDLTNGIAFSNINAFGYTRAAIQALYEDLQGALSEIVGLKAQLAALTA